MSASESCEQAASQFNVTTHDFIIRFNVQQNISVVMRVQLTKRSSPWIQWWIAFWLSMSMGINVVIAAADVAVGS